MFNIDDARKSVIGDCFEIEDTAITEDEGVADVQFMSSFYAGCKDMDSDGMKQALFFEIEDGHTIFDVELQRLWRVEA